MVTKRRPAKRRETKKRKVYTIYWRKGFGGSGRWVCKCGQDPIIINNGPIDKETYIAAVVRLAKQEKPSQVVIKGKNGRIQSERTYLNDPKRYKG